MKWYYFPLALLAASLSGCDTQFATRDANVRTTFNFSGFSQFYNSYLDRRIQYELELAAPSTTEERKAALEIMISTERKILNDIVSQAITTLSTSYTIQITAPNLTQTITPDTPFTTTNPNSRK